MYTEHVSTHRPTKGVETRLGFAVEHGVVWENLRASKRMIMKARAINDLHAHKARTLGH